MLFKFGVYKYPFKQWIIFILPPPVPEWRDTEKTGFDKKGLTKWSIGDRLMTGR